MLLLTSLAADLIDARKRKTSWIHDEVQHAIGLVNTGRLILVPVLLEPDGMIDALRDAMARFDSLFLGQQWGAAAAALASARAVTW